MSDSPYRQGADTASQNGGDSTSPTPPREADLQDPKSAREAIQQAVRSDLRATDLEMVRVLEDLISTLVDKGVINLTDLPKAAQDKIATRGTMRSKLSDLRGIVGYGDDLMLP